MTEHHRERELLKPFRMNSYNFCKASLCDIDREKGRGVVAQQDIPANQIICLFPGREVSRLPDFGSFPREEWPFRSKNDQEKLDASQEYLPLSEYAISLSVLDFDKTQTENGYHWRTLDPLADDEAIDGADGGGTQFRQLWSDHHSVDFLEPGALEIPESVAAMISQKSETLYSRLLTNITKLRAVPIRSAEQYEFVIDTKWYTAPVILLNVNGQLEFICARSDVEDTAYVLRNIKEALGKGFDAKGHAKHSHRLSIVEKAKRLLLPSSYPHFAPFINHPYPAERPNAIFVDPNDWIPPLTRGKMAPAPADLAYLVQEARASDLTPSRLDYLQRPAVKTLRRIRSGEEILVDYNRDS